MKKQTVLLQQSSTHLDNWEEVYLFLKGFAISRGMKNTLVALTVARQLHEKQKRKGGEPYIIHPLEVTLYLIYLNITDDITCAASILHDVVEDCDIKDPYKEIGEKYGLDKEVIDIVLLLTKAKDYKINDPNLEKYFKKICADQRALIIKLADRANNLSTIDVFTKEKMISYVNETREQIFPLCKFGKSYYPGLSNAITIIKYQMVSICETIESMYDICPISSSPTAYRKTLLFIRGYAKGKSLPNTLKALALAERLHEGQTRKCGDPFIIHPLRVCSYLISLKIDDDTTCAASLLHEVFKMCDMDREKNEIVEKYGLDQEVLDLIRLVSKPDSMNNEAYYANLKSNSKAVLIKLSNRANTCTRLSLLNQAERKDYIKENMEYIYPLCTYAESYFPEYIDQVTNMKYHIACVCRVLESLQENGES